MGRYRQTDRQTDSKKPAKPVRGQVSLPLADRSSGERRKERNVERERSDRFMEHDDEKKREGHPSPPFEHCQSTNSSIHPSIHHTVLPLFKSSASLGCRTSSGRFMEVRREATAAAEDDDDEDDNEEEEGEEEKEEEKEKEDNKEEEDDDEKDGDEGEEKEEVAERLRLERRTGAAQKARKGHGEAGMGDKGERGGEGGQEEEEEEEDDGYGDEGLAEGGGEE